MIELLVNICNILHIKKWPKWHTTGGLREVKNNLFSFSNTLIYGISRDGSQNFNIHTCEHMILGQLRMGARQAKNAPHEVPKILIARSL